MLTIKKEKDGAARQDYPRDVLTADPASWVDQHADCLYRYALSRLRNPSAAEDLVQETLMAAFQARHTFAGQSAERTWLIGILKHKIIDHIRKYSRELPVTDPQNLTDPQEGLFHENGHWRSDAGPKEWGSDPEKLLQQKEFRRILGDCLAELPPRLAQVFTLREMEGLSTEEICTTLSISSTNLWVMLHRARAQLRKTLEVKYFHSPQEKSTTRANA